MPASRPVEVAAVVHSAAIRLLRQLRTEDLAMGLTSARASVLSILVFTGPRNVTELAALEQVRPPTMTQMLDRLERDGLVVRRRSGADRRAVEVAATPKGTRLLHAGRDRRVAVLAGQLAGRTPDELRTLEEAARILASLGPPFPPRANSS